MIGIVVALATLSVLLAAALAWSRRSPRLDRRTRVGRILVPFTGGALDGHVLAAAIRIARAESATLVPAYLIVVPLELDGDAPMQKDVSVAMPLLEAVEHAALRSGVPVDARVESGRTPIHALQRLWDVEHFDRIVVPAPAGRKPGFTTKDLAWMLTHAPSETVILRPDPLRNGNGAVAGENSLRPSGRPFPPNPCPATFRGRQIV
ncbi:MAG TPA: hypothetical protein VGL76_10995 [Gaiellaceae bacterium]